MLNMKLLKDSLEAIEMRFKSCDVAFSITFVDGSVLTNQEYFNKKNKMPFQAIKRIDILNQYSDDYLIEHALQTTSFITITSNSNGESNDSRLNRIIEQKEMLNKQLNEFQKILQEINFLQDDMQRTVIVHTDILKTDVLSLTNMIGLSRSMIYRIKSRTLKEICIRINMRK